MAWFKKRPPLEEEIPFILAQGEIRRLSAELEKVNAHNFKLASQDGAKSEQLDVARDVNARLMKKARGYKARALLAESKLAELQAERDKVPANEEEAKKQIPPAQRILDLVTNEIPMGDQAKDQVRAYIDRQLRLRGSDAEDEILAEVLAGDTSSDDDNEG